MIKRIVVFGFIMFVLQAFLPLHPLKMSVSDMTLENDKVVVKMKIFSDDLQVSLSQFEKKAVVLSEATFTDDKKKIIQKYLSDKFKVNVNSKQVLFQSPIISYKTGDSDNDVVLVTYTSKENFSLNTIKKLAVQNISLFDFIPEQKNVVNIHFFQDRQKVMMFENESESSTQEINF